MHLNKGAAFSDWLDIRVYVPEQAKDAKAVWHLTRNPAAQVKNIMTIGVFEGHAFFRVRTLFWTKNSRTFQGHIFHFSRTPCTAKSKDVQHLIEAIVTC